MIIVFNCPTCGATLRMKEQYGGQRGRCPQCQGAITVPAIESEAGMDLLPMEGGAPGAPPPSQTPSAPFSLGSRFSQPAQTPSSPPAGQTPTSTFSLGSKLPAAGNIAAGGHAASLGGDSNIGLAPLEDRAAKSATPAASSPAVARSPSTDSGIGLAPLEERDAKPHEVRAAAPASPAAETSEEFGLSPMPGSAAKTVASNAADTKSAPSSEEVQRIVCAKCGAKMRVPPNAAGKQVVCPKCKNKQRVPDAVDGAANGTSKPAGGAAPRSAPSDSGQDLGVGMLDMLGDDAASTGLSSESSGAAGLAGPKRLGGRAKDGLIFGLPSLAVYAGAAVVALVGALVLVFLLGGFGGSGTPSIAQAPAASVPTPTAATTVVSSPVSKAPSSTTPQSGAPSAAAPAATAAAPAPSAPMPTGAVPTTSAPQGSSSPMRDLLQRGGAAATPESTPAPTTANPGALPISGTTPAATAADPANWRQRVPMVRLQPDADPRPGEPSAPAGDPNEPDQWVQEVRSIQNQLVETLPTIVDVDAARRIAPAWADLTASGLDAVRKIRRSGGMPKRKPQPAAGDGGGGRGMSLQAIAARAVAQNQEPELLGQIDIELQRVSQLPGAMAILEEELRKRATNDPTGALAAALAERGIAVPGAAK